MGKGDGTCNQRPPMHLTSPQYTLTNPRPVTVDTSSSLSKYVQLVPVDVLKGMLEYDRRPGSEHAHRDQDAWNELKADIARNGIEEEITVDYDPDTGQAYVSEGCHRVLIAEELGHAAVPAKVMTGPIRARPDTPRASALRQLTEPGALVDDFNHIPQYLAPCMLGLADPEDRVRQPKLDPSHAREPGGRGVWTNS